MVRGLEEKFGDRMAFAIRNYQEGSSPAEIEQYGLDVHGMVMTDSDGTAVWSESGHNQTEAGVTAAINKALGG